MPYRDDEGDLLVRKQAIEAELAALEAQSKEIEVLEWERRSELKELDERVQMAQTRLPMLDNVRVAAPCNADWNAMLGDERVRYCEACEKNVYNLSALTSAQAEALLREKEGNLCVRLFRRKDGTVLTSDCPVGVKKRRVRNSIAGVVAAAGAGAVAALHAPSLNETEEPRFERSTSAYFIPKEGEPQELVGNYFGSVIDDGLMGLVEANPPRLKQPETPGANDHHIFGRTPSR